MTVIDRSRGFKLPAPETPRQGTLWNPPTSYRWHWNCPGFCCQENHNVTAQHKYILTFIPFVAGSIPFYTPATLLVKSWKTNAHTHTHTHTHLIFRCLHHGRSHSLTRLTAWRLIFAYLVSYPLVIWQLAARNKMHLFSCSLIGSAKSIQIMWDTPS